MQRKTNGNTDGTKKKQLLHIKHITDTTGFMVFQRLTVSLGSLLQNEVRRLTVLNQDLIAHGRDFFRIRLQRDRNR